MLFPQTVIVTEIVALIFEGVEGFIFDFPTGSPPSHNRIECPFGQRQIGTRSATEMAYLVPLDFPVFQKVDQHLLMTLIQGHLIDEPVAVKNLTVLVFISYGLARFAGSIYIIEQKGVIALFDQK